MIFVNIELFQSPMIFNPNTKKEVWRFLSYMFVHSGYFHICFNVIIQVTRVMVSLIIIIMFFSLTVDAWSSSGDGSQVVEDHVDIPDWSPGWQSGSVHS